MEPWRGGDLAVGADKNKGHVMQKLFELGEEVSLALSGEKGIVTGIAEYLGSTGQYRVQYVNGSGCQVEDWFFPASTKGNASEEFEKD